MYVSLLATREKMQSFIAIACEFISTSRLLNVFLFGKLDKRKLVQSKDQFLF